MKTTLPEVPGKWQRSPVTSKAALASIAFMSAGQEAKFPAAAWVAMLVAVPVLYVVTGAPVAALYDCGRLPTPPPRWLVEFYVPMRWLYESTPLRTPLEMYLEWWHELLRKP